MGQLLPFSGEWDPASGTTESERLTGGAIVLLCSLAAAAGDLSASSLLWPAVHKGLSVVPLGDPWPNANRTCRALILLENGCRLGILSGMGNGDMVIDPRKEQMMPPPPNIEALLSNAVDFLLQHIDALTSGKIVAAGARSADTNRVSSTFARLISQTQMLHDAYPSSLAVTIAANKMLKVSIDRLTQGQLNAIVVVRNTALAYGALSCAADPAVVAGDEGLAGILELCRLILNLNFVGDVDGSNEQTSRSVFQYAKWGALSCLLSSLLDQRDLPDSSERELEAFLNELFLVAEESLYATPVDALLPLFNCVTRATRSWLSIINKKLTGSPNPFAEKLSKIIAALLAIMVDSSSRNFMFMLNEICFLLFRSNLLVDEYERLLLEGDDADAPIRDAFRHLMEMAGKQRPHISKAVLCRISVAWLGNQSAEDGQLEPASAGLGSIPYRTDIVDLLIHKEAKIDESSLILETEAMTRVMELPVGTNDMSVVRGFVLVFISKLPSVEEGLPAATLKELLHFIIIRLLDDVCLVPPENGAMLMTGTPEYSSKIRAWQALCVLSRFVTADIASEVCDRMFACMSQHLHGQIRYFLEAFAIQCARKHPSVFGSKLVTEISRRDLSLQHVTSLMIIAGNLIVGRYQLSFFRQFDGSTQKTATLHEILAGTIPWLSSTQGFR